MSATNQTIRIKLKSFDFKLLDHAVAEIVDTVKRSNAKVRGPIPRPTSVEKLTLLRSPHADKRGQEQFETRTHRRLLDIVEPTSTTIDALMKLELSSGVKVEVKQI